LRQFDSSHIHNVAVLSHSGAGKTSLVEAMLFNTGAITRLGKVTEGTTSSDYDPEEVKRKISINLSLLPFEWKNSKVNIIDIPGYPDFISEVKAGLRISEGAVVVVCAASGVEVGTEQVWNHIDKAKLPSLVFINKMDRENASFYDTLKTIQEKLNTKCLPIQLPIGSQKDFQGFVDLLTKKAYIGNALKETDIPPNLSGEVDSLREKLVEAVVEVDDNLLTKYLDGQEITLDEVSRCIKQATILGKVVPVLVGSALNNIGINPLIDAISGYLPSPKEKGAIKVNNGSTNAEEIVEPIPECPLAALVFKTTTDPHVGKISYFRVYSGTITSSSQAWNVNRNANERIGQLFMLRGKNQEAVTQVGAGDIGAVAKLAVTATSDTLGSREHPLKLASIEFPKPIICKAVHPKSKLDLDKMSTALPKSTEEDMTLHIQREADVGEILLCGMGETHLDVTAERMLRKFGVDLSLDPPKVPYKETIKVSVKTEYKHKKQTGGHGQYGHVLFEMEPLPRGSGFEFTEKIVGGSVPRNFIPAVEKGVNEAKIEGILAKYRVVDLRVTLYDGSYHDVDSSEMAFKIAAAQAFKKGLTEGQPILLEPIMNISITVPDTFTGDIISDLNSKRARVLGMSPESGFNIIQAQAPQAEIQRYAIDLRSITQGRGTFTTVFDHYEEVPAQITQKIVALANQSKE
jgi:elongation factor G